MILKSRKFIMEMCVVYSSAWLVLESTISQVLYKKQFSNSVKGCHKYSSRICIHMSMYIYPYNLKHVLDHLFNFKATREAPYELQTSWKKVALSRAVRSLSWTSALFKLSFPKGPSHLGLKQLALCSYPGSPFCGIDSSKPCWQRRSDSGYSIMVPSKCFHWGFCLCNE